MGHFWAQNQHFWTFVSICSIGFSDIVPDDNNEKVTAFDFQEKFYYAQSKVNRSSVGVGDPFLFLVNFEQILHIILVFPWATLNN